MAKKSSTMARLGITSKDLLPLSIQKEISEDQESHPALGGKIGRAFAAAQQLKRGNTPSADASDKDTEDSGLPPESPDEEVLQFWKKELEDAREREDTYRKEAYPIVDLYEAESRDTKSEFNILYANTDTLLPAVYSQTPRPQVRRRNQGAMGIGGASQVGNGVDLLACRVGERMLRFFLDTGSADMPTFDDLATEAVVNALVAGRGMIRCKYDANIVTSQQDGQKVDAVQDEWVSAEIVPWDRVLFGFSRSWATLPWLAFEHYMTRSELIDNFGDDLGKAIPCNAQTSDTMTGRGDDSGSAKVSPPSDSKGAKLALIYEIWDKQTKTVIFYAPDYADNPILAQLPDPLSLRGFFPCPMPLMFFRKISSLMPKPLYQFYRGQAEELNLLTVRIKKITKALKVRGFYNTEIGSLTELLKSEDNTLLPSTGVAAMQQNGGDLAKNIWLMPLTELVAVLQQLMIQRDKIKSIIYEITGISDIIRGATAASETLGAQQIKQNWVTLRIKRAQKSVQSFLRDTLRIMAEIGMAKLSPQTIMEMTGVDLPTAEEKQIAQQKLAALQAQSAPMPGNTPSGNSPGGPAPSGGPMPGLPPAGGTTPPPGVPSAPSGPGGAMPPAPAPASAPAMPSPPPPDPQMLQGLQLVATTPTMEEVMAELSNNTVRRFRIDIETNSTLDSQASNDKQEVSEFLNAMAQFLAGIAPLSQAGILNFDAEQAIMLDVCRRFNFSDDVEEALLKMQPPQEQKSDPKADAEKQKMDLEAQKTQQEISSKQQLAAVAVQLKQMELQAKQQELQMEMQIKELEAQLKMKDIQRRQELAEAEHSANMKMSQMKALGMANGVNPQPAAGADPNQTPQPQPAAVPAQVPAEPAPPHIPGN